MASAVAHFEEGRSNELTLYVRSTRPVPAVELGRLLSALDKGFRTFVRQETGRSGARLVILDSGKGSLWIRLAAAFGAHEIVSAAPDLLPAFVDSISYALKLAMDHDAEEAPKYLRDLLKSIGQAGKRTMADAIDVISTVRVSLDPVAFDVVVQQDTSAPAKTASNPLLGVPGWDSHEQISAAEERVKAGSFVGKLYHVAERWYALPEGMHDVMLPLTLPEYSLTVPEHGREYRIRGELKMSDEGHPIRIDAERLTPTDPGSPMLGLPPPMA